MVYYFPRCPVPIAAPVSISFSPVPGWLQPGVSNHPIAAPLPHGRPFPLCQPVFRLVSAITPR